MTKRGKLCTVALAAAIGLQLAMPVAAMAQTTTDKDLGTLKLTTSPLPVNLVGKPGSTVTTKLEVKNGNDKPETLKVGLLKFSAYGEEGKPELKDREPGDDYFDWVTFSETTFVAEPDKPHAITMTVALPPEAALGYYYAVTFTRASVPKSAQSNKLQGGTAILVLVEARVDNAKRELKIEQFATTRRSYEFLPAEFTIKLQNTGNIHLAATGNIFVKKGNKNLATLNVNSSGGNILPNSKRGFSSQWRDGFPVYEPLAVDGKVQLKDGVQQYKLKWDLSKIGRLRMGKYTAYLTMAYSDGEKDIPLEAVVTFWVIPWRIILFTVLPLVAIVLLAISYLRLRRKLKKQQAKG